MTDQKLIRLIEDNGLNLHGDIEHFAALVAAAEREACAKVADGWPDYEKSTGMDLRDYFAAQAMNGLIHHFDFGTFRDDPLRVARWAYDAADAMMKARGEK